MQYVYEYDNNTIASLEFYLKILEEAGLYDDSRDSLLRFLYRHMLFQDDFKFKYNFLKNK